MPLELAGAQSEQSEIANPTIHAELKTRGVATGGSDLKLRDPGPKASNIQLASSFQGRIVLLCGMVYSRPTCILYERPSDY